MLDFRNRSASDEADNKTNDAEESSDDEVSFNTSSNSASAKQQPSNGGAGGPGRKRRGSLVGKPEVNQSNSGSKTGSDLDEDSMDHELSSISRSTRSSRKRVHLSDGSIQDGSPKRSREDNRSDMENSDAGEEGEGSDSDGEEETPREMRQIIRQQVNDRLATRVPGNIFLQDGPCFQMAHEGHLMCHMCKYMPLKEKRGILAEAKANGGYDENEISCCFYSFRKLRATKAGGSLTVAGYLDPQKDPKEEQLQLWTESLST